MSARNELRRAKKSGDPVSRPRVKQRLGAVLAALGGGEDGNRKGIISLAGDPNQQALLGELQKSIEGMTDRLERQET